MTYKVFSLGCKVNSYECSAVSACLKEHGYVEDNNNPDVIIINTCSVTSTADQKSRQHIRKFKKLYPNAIIVVMGCYAQGNKDFISNEIQPTILIGTSNRNRIIELINKYLKTKEKIVCVDENPRKFTYEELGVTSYSENVRSYLKIQDGCDNFCTYCIVPYRRGKMRSRNQVEILKEAQYLISQGYQEIVLSGIHVGGYGKDLGDINFSTLVSEISSLEGLNSLRISSIEESEIDDKLISLIKERKNIAHHLHIPLQSGSDNILKKMNRKYSSNDFISKINKIKNEIPDIAISTDVIVGFPGESDEDFLNTFNLCKNCFDLIHVFPYSPRQGTPAAAMDNQIAPQIKNARCDILLNLSKELYANYSQKFIGKEVEVLIEQYDENKKQNIGHTSNYIEVAIDSLESCVGKRITTILKESMIISR